MTGDSPPFVYRRRQTESGPSPGPARMVRGPSFRAFAVLRAGRPCCVQNAHCRGRCIHMERTRPKRHEIEGQSGIEPLSAVSIDQGVERLNVFYSGLVVPQSDESGGHDGLTVPWLLRTDRPDVARAASAVEGVVQILRQPIARPGIRWDSPIDVFSYASVWPVPQNGFIPITAGPRLCSRFRSPATPRPPGASRRRSLRRRRRAVAAICARLVAFGIATTCSW